MLQTIHDKITGWVAYVILGAIALVFVLWGINWTLGAPNYAAKVNGSEISVNEVRQSYQQQLAQMERASPKGLDDSARNDIKRKVLDDYVNSEMCIRDRYSPPDRGDSAGGSGRGTAAPDGFGPPLMPCRR